MTIGSGGAVQAAILTDKWCSLEHHLLLSVRHSVSMGLETARGVVTMFVEYFALDLTMEDEERCLRCTAMCVEDGFIHRFKAHFTILSTDGCGRVVS